MENWRKYLIKEELSTQIFPDSPLVAINRPEKILAHFPNDDPEEIEIQIRLQNYFNDYNNRLAPSRLNMIQELSVLFNRFFDARKDVDASKPNYPGTYSREYGDPQFGRPWEGTLDIHPNPEERPEYRRTRRLYGSEVLWEFRKRVEHIIRNYSTGTKNTWTRTLSSGNTTFNIWKEVNEYVNEAARIANAWGGDLKSVYHGPRRDRQAWRPAAEEYTKEKLAEWQSKLEQLKIEIYENLQTGYQKLQTELGPLIRKALEGRVAMAIPTPGQGEISISDEVGGLSFPDDAIGGGVDFQFDPKK